MYESQGRSRSRGMEDMAASTIHRGDICINVIDDEYEGEKERVDV
jgi:hypothetical protein